MTNNKSEKIGEIKSPSNAESVRLVSGLISGALSVYTFIALTSYLFSWSQDQSLLGNPDIWTNSVNVENFGGKVGFLWANFLLSDLFGLGAFVIPFFFAGVAIYAFNIRKINLAKLILISVYGSIIISLTFSYIFSYTKLDYWFGGGAGGSYGYFVNKWLISMFGAPGAGALIFIILFIWLILMGVNVVTWTNKLIDQTFHKEKPIAPVEQDEIIPPVVMDEIGDDFTSDVEPGLDIDEDLNLIIAESEESLIVDDENAGDNRGDLNTRFDPRLDLPNYQAPPLSLLMEYKDKIFDVSEEELNKNANQIKKTLMDFKISTEKITAKKGPTVTLYEIIPSAGVKVAQIKRLEDDIALSLSALGVRIIAPIPGTNAIGIEVPNEKASFVPMRSMLDDPKFKNSNYDLPVVLGKSVTNHTISFDLTKMPHLLVAGATGQGKSIGLNVILTSLLYTKHPSELKFVLVDPKKVELSLYQKIEKHFLAKMINDNEEDAIITDTKKVINTLQSLCIEMEDRYDLLKNAVVRNIKEYNEKYLSRKLLPTKGHRYLPYIVVVIDEFADMFLTAGREIEEPLIRLAQKARATGIHLVIATQRPSANIITGLIKSNFPARIAFKVVSGVDSKIIIDTVGANQLVTKGDMLMLNGTDLTRLQCAFIDTGEVEKVTEFIGDQTGYPEAYKLPEFSSDEDGDYSVNEVDLKKRDSLFDEAARLIVQNQMGSTSFIQRRMNLGYNRAGRIMDQLEAAGIVGSAQGSKPREVLVYDMRSLESILSSLG